MDDIEKFAGQLYEEYCAAVGGKAFNNDPLPTWEAFRADVNKAKQSDAWVRVAHKALAARTKKVKAAETQMHGLDRVVLGTGYPWALGEPPYTFVGLRTLPVGGVNESLHWCPELWTRTVLRYRLVLERAEDRSCQPQHVCHCGTEAKTPHLVHHGSCVRIMTAAPVAAPLHPTLNCQMWFVDGADITDYTLRNQRGYYQHPCGCWSRAPGSSNSIDET